ncbi:hypothetical protein IFM47457_03854 [Aspergillus lentulus]|nr:hypothetical protein IFM47457_03854 [Aspergillus lentulus]
MFGSAAGLEQAGSALADAKGTSLPVYNPMTTAPTGPDSPDKHLHLSSGIVGLIQMPPNSGKYGHLHIGRAASDWTDGNHIRKIFWTVLHLCMPR